MHELRLQHLGFHKKQNSWWGNTVGSSSEVSSLSSKVYFGMLMKYDINCFILITALKTSVTAIPSILNEVLFKRCNTDSLCFFWEKYLNASLCCSPTVHSHVSISHHMLNALAHNYSYMLDYYKIKALSITHLPPNLVLLASLLL